MSAERELSSNPSGSASLARDAEQRDHFRRRCLTRNRLLASGLLAAMGTIYVATHAVVEPGSWVC